MLFSVVLIIVNEKIVIEMCQLKRILEYLHVSMFVFFDCTILKNFRCKKISKQELCQELKCEKLKRRRQGIAV